MAGRVHPRARLYRGRLAGNCQGMIAMTTNTITTIDTRATLYPRWVRICHWINALAILVMIGSGWQIYNASPLFDFVFPRQIALGNWLAGALLCIPQPCGSS